MGVMFDKDVDSFAQLLNPKKCVYHAAGESFDLIETKKEGKAKLTVTRMAFPCIYVPKVDDECTFSLLDEGNTGKERVRRCADHIVFIFDPGTIRWSVHIFELTRTLSESVWDDKVLIQFTGALVRAYAVAGVLQIQDFHRIYLHCGYRQSSLDASFARHKRPTGKSAPRNYLTEPITLYSPFHRERFTRKTLNCPIRLDSGTGEATIPSLDI